MLINRPVNKLIALVLGGAAVAVAAQTSAQALSDQPGDRAANAATGVAAVPLLLGLPGSARPALSPDSGLAGCKALSGAHQAAAKDYPQIGAQFAISRWPDLRVSGLAYIDIATKLLTTHAYGGETVWFYERLAAACAEHGRPLPFWPG